MATELMRKNMVESYAEAREPDMFLSGFFPVPVDGISDTENVSIDIERESEEISPVVNTCEGPTMNTANVFTTKQFTPPMINEAMPFDCREFLSRMAGQTEYAATDMGFQAAFMAKVIKGLAKLEKKVRRNREWQASQILQTGILTLVDSDGNPVYVVDYQPKATHFPTVGTDWGQAGANPLNDLETLFDLIRDDSLQDVDRVIMGASAFNAFINHATVQNAYDNRRINLGEIAPAPTGVGGKRQGSIHVGNYEVEIWTFNGRGVIPGASTKTKFVADGNVICMASSGRLDTVFAGVPTVVDVDPRFADILPDRIAVPTAADIQPNIWTTADGKQTVIEVSSRPQLIPVAIDSYGTLDSGV